MDWMPRLALLGFGPVENVLGITVTELTCFKAYDIRGIVGKTLTNNIIKIIGHSIGSEAQARGLTSIAIGRDGRLSGSELSHSLAEGIQESGINVLDVGMVATPMLYFASHFFKADGAIQITGSHNPKNYNGIKMVINNSSVSGNEILTVTNIYYCSQ